MARKSREKSDTQDYHTMLRGINKQDIFFDTQDKIRFENNMKEAKEKFHFSLYSFSLMPNHVHMEIKDRQECLSKIMHFLALAYAVYFNKKYDRVGSLFQGRYCCRAINDEEYLVNLVRYIHQNPQKAGIAPLQQYQWSSYRAYVRNENDFVDIDLVLDKFDENRECAIAKFIEFNKQKIYQKNPKEILENEFCTRITDDELISYLQSGMGIGNIQEIQQYNRKYRDEIIRKIYEIKGTNLEQISRVLGLHIKILQRAIKNKE